MKKSKAHRSKKGLLLILIAILLLIVLAYTRSLYRDYKIGKEIELLEQQVRSLQSKRIESMDVLQYVTSQQYVEDAARSELNLKENGEEVVFINDLLPSQDAPKAEQKVRLNNSRKWWYYFTTHSLIPIYD